MLKYDWSLLIKSKWRIMETFYFPLATLVLWGFFLIYARPFALQIGMIILTIQVFWVMASLSQTTISLQMMDDIWTRSLRELLISPLTPIEFLTGRILLAITRATLIITVLITASHFVLKLKLLDNIVFTSVSVLLTLFASMGLAIFTISFILILGREYGFLAWSVTEAVFFLSAPFYPVSVFPEPLRTFVHIFPYTWIFEGIRIYVSTNTFDKSIFMMGGFLSSIFFLASIPTFLFILKRARKKGKLIRLWA